MTHRDYLLREHSDPHPFVIDRRELLERTNFDSSWRVRRRSWTLTDAARLCLDHYWPGVR